MNWNQIPAILNQLSTVSIYSVLLVLLGVTAWMLWSIVTRLFDNTDIYRKSIDVLTENSSKIAATFEAHTIELSRNSQVMNEVIDFCRHESEWMKTLLSERLDQASTLSRLEQNSTEIVGKLDKVQGAVHAILKDRHLPTRR